MRVEGLPWPRVFVWSRVPQCSLCDKTSWADLPHTSDHPRQGSHDKPKYGYLLYFKIQKPDFDEPKFYWGYLQSRNDSKTALSPKPTLACVTAHKAGNMKHSTQPA